MKKTVGSKSKQTRRKSGIKHIRTSGSRLQSSSKHEKTTERSLGNGRRSSNSSEATGSKSLHCASSTTLTKHDKSSSPCLSRISEIAAKRYGSGSLCSIGAYDACLNAKKDWEQEQVDQWSPQMHLLINTHEVLGMDRTDVEQELRLTIIKCSYGYREGFGTKFQSYLCTSMIRKLFGLRQDESKWFKLPEKVWYNTSEASDRFSEIEILNDKRYTVREQRIMRAAMNGMTGKDIRDKLGMKVKEFNKARRVIGEKMLQADPELATVLGLAQESR